MTANRVQSWAIILSSYTCNIQYKPTKKYGNADTLSKLPIAADQQVQQDCCLTHELNLMHSVQLQQLALQTADVAEATKSDKILSQVTNSYRKDG